MLSASLPLIPPAMDLGSAPDCFGFVGDLKLPASNSCDDSPSCSLSFVGFAVIDCFSSGKAGASVCAIDALLVDVLIRLLPSGKFVCIIDGLLVAAFRFSSSGKIGVDACVIDALLIDFLNPFLCCAAGL